MESDREMKKFIFFTKNNIKFNLYEKINIEYPIDYDIDQFYNSDSGGGLEEHIDSILENPETISAGLKVRRDKKTYQFDISPTKGQKAKGKTDFTSRIITENEDGSETVNARAHELKLGSDSRIISPVVNNILSQLGKITKRKTVRAKISKKQSKIIAEKIKDHYHQSMSEQHTQMNNGEIPETYISITKPKDLEDHTKCTIHPNPIINKLLHKKIMDSKLKTTNKRIILQRLHLIHETINGPSSNITRHYSLHDDQKNTSIPSSGNFVDVFSPGIKVLLHQGNRYIPKNIDGRWYIVNSATQTLNYTKDGRKITNKSHDTEEDAIKQINDLHRQGITIDFRRK